MGNLNSCFDHKRIGASSEKIQTMYNGAYITSFHTMITNIASELASADDTHGVLSKQIEVLESMPKTLNKIDEEMETLSNAMKESLEAYDDAENSMFVFLDSLSAIITNTLGFDTVAKYIKDGTVDKNTIATLTEDFLEGATEEVTKFMSDYAKYADQNCPEEYEDSETWRKALIEKYEEEGYSSYDASDLAYAEMAKWRTAQTGADVSKNAISEFVNDAHTTMEETVKTEYNELVDKYKELGLSEEQAKELATAESEYLDANELAKKGTDYSSLVASSEKYNELQQLKEKYGVTEDKIASATTSDSGSPESSQTASTENSGSQASSGNNVQSRTQTTNSYSSSNSSSSASRPSSTTNNSANTNTNTQTNTNSNTNSSNDSNSNTSSNSNTNNNANTNNNTDINTNTDNNSNSNTNSNTNTNSNNTNTNTNSNTNTNTSTNTNTNQNSTPSTNTSTNSTPSANQSGGYQRPSGGSNNTTTTIPETSTTTPSDNTATTTPSSPESDANITDNTGETLDVISIDKGSGKTSVTTSSNDGGSVIPTVIAVGAAGAAAVAGAKILHDKNKQQNEYSYDDNYSENDNSISGLETYSGSDGDIGETQVIMSAGKYRAGNANNLILENAPADIKIDESLNEIAKTQEELE